MPKYNKDSTAHWLVKHEPEKDPVHENFGRSIRTMAKKKGITIDEEVKEIVRDYVKEYEVPFNPDHVESSFSYNDIKEDEELGKRVLEYMTWADQRSIEYSKGHIKQLPSVWAKRVLSSLYTISVWTTGTGLSSIRVFLLRSTLIEPNR